VISFITLRFEDFWIYIAWVIIGLPLLAILSRIRTTDRTPRVRRAALATFAATLMTGVSAVGLVTGDYEAVFAALLPLSCLLLLGCWIWMLATTRLWWLWADLVVICIPTLLGIWAWHAE
jgi:hypothetical protein